MGFQQNFKKKYNTSKTAELKVDYGKSGIKEGRSRTATMEKQKY
jgi:hypothetical protein